MPAASEGGNGAPGEGPQASSAMAFSPSNLSWKRDIQYKAELLRAQKEMILANERALDAERRAKEIEARAKDIEQKKAETERLIETLRSELGQLSLLKASLTASQSNLNPVSTPSSSSSRLSSPESLGKPLPALGTANPGVSMSSNLSHKPSISRQAPLSGGGPSALAIGPGGELAIHTQTPDLLVSDAATPLTPTEGVSATTTGGTRTMIGSPSVSSVSTYPGGSSQQGDSFEFDSPSREYYPDTRIDELVMDVALSTHRAPEKAHEWISRLHAQDIMTVGDLKQLHEEDWNNLNLTVFASRALKNAMLGKYNRSGHALSSQGGNSISHHSVVTMAPPSLSGSSGMTHSSTQPSQPTSPTTALDSPDLGD